MLLSLNNSLFHGILSSPWPFEDQWLKRGELNPRAYCQTDKLSGIIISLAKDKGEVLAVLISFRSS
jgi:hypothetical protein